MKKVKKITPIKSAHYSLCGKCKFSYDRFCTGKKCTDCEMHEKTCKCTTVEMGQPCPYFERYVEEAQQ